MLDTDGSSVKCSVPEGSSAKCSVPEGSSAKCSVPEGSVPEGSVGFLAAVRSETMQALWCLGRSQRLAQFLTATGTQQIL
jgi:hypothetical protein